MEAPEKIYIQPLLTEDGIYIRRRVRLQKEGDSIEYCRKDAFIKKACEFLETYPHMFMGKLRSEMIEDFKKYIEK